MLTIKLSEKEDSKNIITLLNKVTLNLQQKGILQWNVPWDENKVASQISNNHSYVLLLNDEVIGTFCIKDIDYINEFLIEPDSNYLFQIAILPEYQGMNFGSKIIDFSCTLASNLNKNLYLDCFAGNEKLKQFYSKNGLIYIGDFPEEDYFISIFKYNLHTKKA